MWRAARVTDGRRALTLDFYENELGGKRRILDDHIRSRMPERWRDRVFTATLMKFLAPPSGLKISYSSADLAAYTGLDERRIETELRRLSGPDARILRQREFKDSVRFELQHDALIRHVTPWRDGVLADAATVGRIKWAGGAAAVILLLVGGVRLYRWKEVRDNTDKPLNALRAMSRSARAQRAANTFDSVASYLLFKERGADRLDHLKKLLVEHEDLLPEGDATETVDVEALPGGSRDDALAMRFSNDRPFDVESFSHAWSDVAHQISERWGIPVPTRVRLITDPEFPRATIQFESGGRSITSMDLETLEGRALVALKDAPDAAKEFHRRFSSDWQPLPKLAVSDTWAVPRWSVPVWRAAGLHVWESSAYPALVMRAEVDRDPTILLTPASTEFLVHRIAQQYPCTAAEAWALRGLRLRDDVAAWIAAEPGRPRAVLYPHLLLDTVADLRSEASPKRAAGLSSRYLDTVKRDPAAAWPQSSGPATPCEKGKLASTAFQDVEEWLPPLRPKIRIALGADLVRAWTNESRASTGIHITTRGRQADAVPSSAADQRRRVGMSTELVEALEDYRQTLYARSGIWLPEVTFLNASAELSGHLGHHLRIMLLDVQDEDARSIDVGTTDQKGIDRFITALGDAVSQSIVAWVDAESVSDLVIKDPRIQKIVSKLKVSSTDLKILLREVLRPTSEKPASASAAGSVRDSDWLIASLVFWKAYYTDDNAPKITNVLPDLADRFRRLQARRSAPVGAATASAASLAVQRGIDALEASRFDDAERAFQEAIRNGSITEVEKIFVDRYASGWRANRRARIAKECVDPTKATLDAKLRVDVKALLDEPDSQLDRTTSRNLGLCLAASMPSTMPKAKEALLSKFAGRFGGPQDWPPAQAAWLATQLLDQYDPLRDSPAAVDQGARLVTNAIRRFPSKQDANNAFNEVKAICLKPGAKNWCWGLLPAVADARPDPWTALDLALALTGRETAADLHDALQWLDRAAALHASDKTTTKEARQRFDFWATYIRANALYTLGIIDGDGGKLDEAQRLVPSLIEAPLLENDPQLELDAFLLGMTLLTDAPKPDRERAAVLKTRGAKNSPDAPSLLLKTMFDGLRFGDLAVVRQNVRDAIAKASTAKANADNRATFLFCAAVGGLLTKDDRAERSAREFILTDHPYAPLVSMLLSAGTSGVAHDDARRLLQERWARVDRTTWDRRLREGDSRAWYEMLVGYFIGEVAASDIFDLLRDDATFAASKFAGLHVTRKALLTEAHFYDAVRLKAGGDHNGEMASLRRVEDLGYKRYVEYDMAVFLRQAGSASPAVVDAERR